MSAHPNLSRRAEYVSPTALITALLAEGSMAGRMTISRGGATLTDGWHSQGGANPKTGAEAASESFECRSPRATLKNKLPNTRNLLKPVLIGLAA